MFDPSDSCCNALLAAFPAADFNRISPYLERSLLSQNQTLHGPGLPQHDVYFPINCIVSLQTLLSNGACDEVAIVGDEGVVGVALIMGDDHPSKRAVVRRAGEVWRVPAECIRRQFQRSAAVQSTLMRYSQALLAQIAQTAVCNRHHTLDQQLCRWLLMTLDRLPSRELTITQEQIGNMLGVRRESITEAAGRLQRDGAIQYSRGRVDVLDRHKLENNACECYQVVQRECSRLAAPIEASPDRWNAEAGYPCWPDYAATPLEA